MTEFITFCYLTLNNVPPTYYTIFLMSAALLHMSTLDTLYTNSKIIIVSISMACFPENKERNDVNEDILLWITVLVWVTQHLWLDVLQSYKNCIFFQSEITMMYYLSCLDLGSMLNNMNFRNDFSNDWLSILQLK